MDTDNQSGLVQAIEAELERLGELCVDDSPYSCACCAEDNLPYGWVRVYDDYANAYGPGAEILEALQKVDPAEKGEGPVARESAVWEALVDFADHSPDAGSDEAEGEETGGEDADSPTETV